MICLANSFYRYHALLAADRPLPCLPFRPIPTRRKTYLPQNLIAVGWVEQLPLVHTDEYDVYARLEAWGYRHKTVCHGRGEYARDEDGDGFGEVHVDTTEGFWSLLRS